MQVSNGDVTQWVCQLLACPVDMGILGGALTSRVLCSVADQVVGGGAKGDPRV